MALQTLASLLIGVPVDEWSFPASFVPSVPRSIISSVPPESLLSANQGITNANRRCNGFSTHSNFFDAASAYRLPTDGSEPAPRPAEQEPSQAFSRALRGVIQLGMRAEIGPEVLRFPSRACISSCLRKQKRGSSKWRSRELRKLRSSSTTRNCRPPPAGIIFPRRPF